MRTTLKRGVGRGAGLNGNGKIVFPPAAASTVARYTPPPPPGRSGLVTFGRILLFVLLAALCVGVGAVGGAYLYFHQSVATVRAHTPDVVRAERSLDIPVAHHAAIALVIGYDHRAGDAATDPSRSDTVMLIRADPVTKSISLLSFPRDLGVPIYCGASPITTDRINSAYSRCGVKGTLLTVKHLTNLKINYLITVNFHGFKEVVDKLGGVWMDVDRRYYNRNTGSAYDNYANIDLQPGYQKLSGGQALDFVRFRHTDDDYHRLARQQEFVRAFKEQVAQSFDFTKLPELVNAVVSNIEVAEGGHKLQGSEVLSYAFFAKDLPGGHFFQPKIQGVNGFSVTSAPAGAIQKAVGEFENPDVDSSKAANAAALGRRVKSKAPPPSKVSVLVLNGNRVPGAAANASYQLGQRGYVTVTPRNGQQADAPADAFHSQIYYDARQGGAHAAALALLPLLQPASVLPLPRRGKLRALDPDAMVVVVLGQTFHGDLAPAPTSNAPKHQAPSVRTDPSVATPLLTPYRTRAGFPLMVPTVLERNSYADSYNGDVPARLYRIQGKNKAVRLVFRTGAGEYWGVQETNWSDAPVLADKSFRHDLGGREFDLYYSGGNLHMVVLRTPRATYWVVNTLLDSLSNETMLSIAKGLKPLTAPK
ncbi:MAG TPA: LCP family protein [Gaiellaceae bacterium]|nr:LCP family protein [Gaiellaceae bacterium]